MVKQTVAVTKISKAMFPTYILEEGSYEKGKNISQILPEHDPQEDCLVVAKNGLHIYKSGVNGLFAQVPLECQEIWGLAEVEPLIGWRGAKIPSKLFRQIQRFFYDVYQDKGTEAAVVLFYNPKLKDWKVLYPIQTELSGAHVTYLMTNDKEDKKVEAALKFEEQNPEYAGLVDQVNRERIALHKAGYWKMGTIHSHCNMGAFHSGTDTDDEMGFDGIHITIGKITLGIEYEQSSCCGKYRAKHDNITYLIELEENETLEDLKNVEAEDSIYELVKNRLYESPRVNIITYGSGGASRGYYKGGVWNEYDDADDWRGNGYFQNGWQGWSKREYHPNDVVSFSVGGKPFVGVVISRCTIDDDYYFIDTEMHDFPIYCSKWSIHRKIEKDDKTVNDTTRFINDTKHLFKAE